MYSYEIEDIMKKYNYNLPSNIYLKICFNSDQISDVKYSNNIFEIWTKDNYYFKFNVYHGQVGY